VERGQWDLAGKFADAERLYDRFRYHRDELSLDDLMVASGLASELVQLARELSKRVQEILPIGPEVLDRLTYGEAFSYFAGRRPEDARIVKGAMLREEDPKGQLLTQVFLDKDNNLVPGPNRKPYGRRLIVRSLDAELQETFGDKNLVIVE
jgi:hypothetical protein